MSEAHAALAARPAKAAFWKRAVVNILDLFTAFTAAGLLVRAVLGNTPGASTNVAAGVKFSLKLNGLGFEHSGIPALVVLGLVVAYFVVGRYFAGGTIWQRILGTRAQ